MTPLGFRQGWHDAYAALGRLWPGVAALLALASVAAAGVVEAQAVVDSSGIRRIEQALLHGVTFGLVIPLFSFALSARLDLGLGALMGALWVRHGADRRAFALGRLALPLALGCAVTILAGTLALGVSLASSDPAATAPGTATSWGALLGCAVLASASYLAYLGVAELAGGAWGRSLFLIGDWLLGSGDGVAALPWPRAHLRTLLGGHPVFELSPAVAGWWLAALTLACTLLYLRRVPR